MARIETSNQTFNKIPDYCEVWLDIVMKEPAQFVDENNEYMKLLQRTGKQIIKKKIALNQGQGSSDARHYSNK